MLGFLDENSPLSKLPTDMIDTISGSINPYYSISNSLHQKHTKFAYISTEQHTLYIKLQTQFENHLAYLKAKNQGGSKKDKIKIIGKALNALNDSKQPFKIRMENLNHVLQVGQKTLSNHTSSKTYQFITNILQFLSFALYSLIKTHNYKFWNTRSERLIENTNALLLENNQIITATT